MRQCSVALPEQLILITAHFEALTDCEISTIAY